MGNEDCILSVLSGSFMGHPWAEPRPAESHSSQYLLYTCAVNTCVSVLRNSRNRGMPHSLPSLRVNPSYTCLQPLPDCCLPASVFSLTSYACILWNVHWSRTLFDFIPAGFLLLQDLTQPCTVMVSSSSKNPREHAE